MRTNHCLGANDVERLAPPGPPLGEPYPERAIEAPEPRPLRVMAEQGELLPERQVLKREIGAEHGGNRFAEQHRAVERRLSSSGIPATIVRATFFMENILGLAAPIAAGTYPAPTADARMGQIAIADIAAVLWPSPPPPAAHRGATYTLTDPVAYTGDEIASAFAEATGHPVRYVDVPENAFRQRLLDAGLDTWTADGLIEAYRLVRAGATAATTDDVRRVTGRTPIDFASWARTHAVGLRGRDRGRTDPVRAAHRDPQGRQRLRHPSARWFHFVCDPCERRSEPSHHGGALGRARTRSRWSGAILWQLSTSSEPPRLRMRIRRCSPSWQSIALDRRRRRPAAVLWSPERLRLGGGSAWESNSKY